MVILCLIFWGMPILFFIDCGLSYLWSCGKQRLLLLMTFLCFCPSHLFSPSVCFFPCLRVLLRIFTILLILKGLVKVTGTHLLFWVPVTMGGCKVRRRVNCGLRKTSLQLPFFGTDSRKLFCLSCLLVVGFFFFLSPFKNPLVYFIGLGEERFYIIVLFCHFILEIRFFSFCLKL